MSARVLAFVLVAALVVPACGGAESEPGATTVPSGPAAITSTETTVVETTAAPHTEPPRELDGTAWVVDRYDLPDGGGFTNPWPATEVTMAFADGIMSGSTGCNLYTASYATDGPYDPFDEGVPDRADGQTLTLGDLTVTEETCEDENYALQAEEIVQNLMMVGRWVLIRGELNLRDAEGGFLMSGPPAG